MLPAVEAEDKDEEEEDEEPDDSAALALASASRDGMRGAAAVTSRCDCAVMHRLRQLWPVRGLASEEELNELDEDEEDDDEADWAPPDAATASAMAA